MKLGVIARCDSRGIAYQTWEACRGLNPHRVLVVRMNERRWPEDPSRFDEWDHIVTDSHPVSRRLDPDDVDAFLDGLDVVFAVETLYDWGIADVARERGIRTVVQGNPEFYTHDQPANLTRPHPDKWVWPTPWLIDRLPSDTVLPVPAPKYQDAPQADPDDEVLRILHVAGHAAIGDRNGTKIFAEAVPLLGTRCHITMIGQDGALPAERQKRNLTYDLNPSGVKDRWDLYRDQHIVVLPRRYGGLCLPAIEACSMGVVPMMPQSVENASWPIHPLPAPKGRLQRTPAGSIPTYSVRPSSLAAHIDGLNRERGRLALAQKKTLRWAKENQWTKWRAEYERTFNT